MYGRRQRWAWALGDLAAARLSLALAALLVVIGLIVRPSDELGSGEWIYRTFGLSREGIAEGALWQLASHALIHGGMIHVSVNALMLALAGSRVEKIGGAWTLAKVFGTGVLLGGVFHLLLPDGRQESLLVGASGGISALVLWLTTLSPQSKMWPVPVSAKNLGIGLLVAAGMLAVAAPWMPGGPLRIGHACHFGGALGGWLMARHLLRPRVTLAALRKERARRESAGGPS